MSVYYEAAYILLEALSKLEEDIKVNYENGDISRRALANIASLQGDLISSYLLLLDQGAVIGRSVILRSILENQGNILHLKGNIKRSKNYLAFVEKMHIQLKNRVDGIKNCGDDMKWTDSFSVQRVGLIDSSAVRLYDTLSDFVHGNNVQDFMNTQEITEGYIKAIDSYFVGLCIGFMAELGIGLDMSDEKKEMILDAIDKASSLTQVEE